MKAVTIMSSKPSIRGDESRGSGRITRGKLVLVAVVAASLAWLVAGLGIHFNSVAPAQRLVLSEQARTVAKELDAAVKMRSAVVLSALYHRQLENVLASSGLESLVNSIRGQFPDFLSLEVLNVNGEVLAMVGELPLGQANLAPKDAGENVFRVDPRASNTGVFKDDPGSGCFFLTSRHKDSDGTYWYTRTRFARRAIEGLLNEFQGRASLVSIAGGKHDLEQVYGHPARIYGNWWSGPQSADVTLEAPGWLVKVTSAASGSLLRRTSIIFPLVIFVLAAFAWLFRPRVPLQESFDGNYRGDRVTETHRAVLDSPKTSAPSKQVAVEQNIREYQPAEGAILPHVPHRNEVVAADFSTPYHPREESASTENESSVDYFCPPQLIFDPMADAYESSPRENPESDLSLVETEFGDVTGPHGDQISFSAADEIVISEEFGELFISEQSLSPDVGAGLQDELEISEEDESGVSTAQASPGAGPRQVAEPDPSTVSAEIIPDVLEVEWEEPPGVHSSDPKKDAPREAVLFSEFFNC